MKRNRALILAILIAAAKFVLGAAILFGILTFAGWAADHALPGLIICALVTAGILWANGNVRIRTGRRER